MAEVKIVKCDRDLKVNAIKEKKRNKPDIILLLLGVICILYFIGILLVAGFTSVFHLVWLMGGICLGSIAMISKKTEKYLGLPKLVRRTLLGMVMLLIVIFLVLEGLIISGFNQSGIANLDYIIVLGAQVEDKEPSGILQQRLDAAGTYLVDNEDTFVIVSGGQGYDEVVSEASVMKTYLMEHFNISEDRIIIEENSSNTYENLKNSKIFIEGENISVGIVTSNFHIYRSIQLAKAAGYSNVCGMAAQSNFFLLPANMVREFIGLLKDYYVGNMNLF